jgi:hypothetical protein
VLHEKTFASSARSAELYKASDSAGTVLLPLGGLQDVSRNSENTPPTQAWGLFAYVCIRSRGTAPAFYEPLSSGLRFLARKYIPVHFKSIQAPVKSVNDCFLMLNAVQQFHTKIVYKHFSTVNQGLSTR